MTKTKHRSARPPRPQPQPKEYKPISAKVAPSPAPSPSAVKDAVARLQTPQLSAAARHRRQTRRGAGPCGASS
jgi:hypothetical protein